MTPTVSPDRDIVSPDRDTGSPDRDTGLDLLKVFGTISVLFLHLHPLHINDQQGLFAILIRATNHQLLSTAVPIFFVVSLHLFLKKVNSNPKYLYKRLKNLIILFIFWTGFHQAFWFITQVLIAKNVDPYNYTFSWQDILLLLNGRPTLPLVGDSVFYYLFNLILLIPLAFAYQQIKLPYRQLLSLGIIVAFTIYFEFLFFAGIKLWYCRLDIFLVYIAVADIFTNHQKILEKLKYLWLTLYLLFSLQDCIAIGYFGLDTNIYSRAAILYGCLVMFTFIYPLKLGNHIWIRILSKYSLGIYALHKYWQYPLILAMLPHMNSQISFLGVSILIVPLITTLQVLVAIAGTLYILKRTPLKRFIA